MSENSISMANDGSLLGKRKRTDDLPNTPHNPDGMSIPGAASQQSTILQTNLFLDEDTGKVKRLNSQELGALDIDSQILYVFLLASELDDEEIKKLLTKSSGTEGLVSIADYNAEMQYTNTIFNQASDARQNEAKPPQDVYEFAYNNNIEMDPDKKYSKEEWDLFLKQIEGVQNRLSYESELVTYDLEQKMSDAATNMQLATKALSSIQSIRERQVQGLSFR